MHFCVMSNYDLEVLSFHLSLPPCVCLPAVHLSAYPCEVCVPISACAAVLTCAWSLCASVCLPSSLLWWWLSSESWWIKYDLSSYGSLPFPQLPSLLWLCSFLSIKAWTSQFLYLISNSDSFTLLFFFWWEKKIPASIIYQILWYNHSFICKLQATNGVCRAGWQSYCIPTADTMKQISRMLTYLCVGGRALSAWCAEHFTSVNLPVCRSAGEDSVVSIMVSNVPFLMTIALQHLLMYLLATGIWTWEEMPTMWFFC